MRRHCSIGIAIMFSVVIVWALVGGNARGQGVHKASQAAIVRNTSQGDSETADGTKSTVDVKVQSITGNGAEGLVLPPEYQAQNVTRSTSRTRNWGQIKVLYDTRLDWTDQLTVHYFILLLTSDPAAKTKYTLLTGDVTYIDVQRGNNHESAVYLHPNTLARFGEVVACAVAIDLGGQTYVKTAVTTKAGLRPGKWWTGIANEPTVTVKTGYIRERGDTPFALVDYDSYEQVLK